MRRIRSTFALAALLAALPVFAAPPTAAEVAREADKLLADTYPADGPGVVVLVQRGDEVLYRGARGRADVAAGTALTADDHLRIGSVTKQVAAAGLLTLVDAGKVALDDPLSKYLPDYPGGADITIEQLLNHTSGVRSYTSIPGVMDGPIRRDLTTAQLVDYFKGEKPDFAPGEGWAYSNSGYVLVGAVIEAASGQPWHEYLAQAVFAPLGMDDTGYGHDPAVVARQVAGHTLKDGATGPADTLSMTQPHAAGALVSTVDDLARFNRGLHEGKLLKPETYARMTTPAGKAARFHYGFGIWNSLVRGQPVLQHDGGIHGFSAQLTYIPGPDITVVVLHNSDSPLPAQYPGGIARRLAAVALGDPYPPTTPVTVDAAVLAKYEGIYRVDDTVTRTMRVIDGKLTVRRTDRAREELTAIADDTFLYSDGFNRIRMERDAAGKVTGMRLFSDGEGEGDVAPRTDEPLPVAVVLPDAALARLVGVYRAADGAEMRVTREGAGLNGHITGQPQGVPFEAMSAHRFTGDIVGAELVFAPEGGDVERLTLRQFGQDMVFERVAAK